MNFVSVSLTRGSREIIRDVSLDVVGDAVTAFRGPSGAGKSTLLRLALGLAVPTSGSVLWDARDLPAIEPAEKRRMRQRFGVVLQDSAVALNPHHRVRELLLYGCTHAGLPAPSSEDLRRALEQVGLTESVLGRFPVELSSGQRQRVAIARGLLRKPLFWFLDEPVAALDPIVAQQITELLAGVITRAGAGALLVSHEPKIVARLATRCFDVRDGCVTPAELHR